MPDQLGLQQWGRLRAAERLTTDGVSLRVIFLRLLAPLRREALRQALTGVKRVLVVEQNHSGQLYHYLKAHDALPEETRLLAKPGPILLRPGEIVKAVTERV